MWHVHSDTAWSGERRFGHTRDTQGFDGDHPVKRVLNWRSPWLDWPQRSNLGQSYNEHSSWTFTHTQSLLIYFPNYNWTALKLTCWSHDLHDGLLNGTGIESCVLPLTKTIRDTNLVLDSATQSWTGHKSGTSNVYPLSNISPKGKQCHKVTFIIIWKLVHISCPTFMACPTLDSAVPN